MTTNSSRRARRGLILREVAYAVALAALAAALLVVQARGWPWPVDVVFLIVMVALMWWMARRVKRLDPGCFPAVVGGPAAAAGIVRDRGETAGGGGGRP